MPNKVANRLTIEGENVRELILSLLTFDEYGDEADFDFNKVIPMPKSVKDKPNWAKRNWGCKNNASYTNVDFDKNCIEFETDWCHCLPVVEKIAEKYPDYIFTYEYSTDEAGSNVGEYVFVNGHLNAVVELEPLSKEAYELYFDLWGTKYGYTYSEEEGTYIPKTKKLKFYELIDVLGHKMKLYPIIREYLNSGRLAIELVDENYETFDYLTVNIRDNLSDNNDNSLSFVDTNNHSWAEDYIVKNKLGKKTGHYGMSGYCSYPEYKFDLTKLNEEPK